MQKIQWLMCLLAGLLFYPLAAQSETASTQNPPQVMREFRAAWVATVANIDWPSRPGLPVEKQKQEMIDLLDTCQQLNLNAIVLQVRPSCDALYESKLEPWSAYLTGKMGEAPQPYYDPLEFAVTEAHRRGIELHAWFNPYRALHSSAKGEVSEGHISKTQPEVVREYGSYLWLDPGEPAATDHTLAVILDVVNRYDIDGVHFDDYFYPYPIRDDDGNLVQFPDDASWQKAVDAGTTLERDDWRRQNVDLLVKRLNEEIHAVKPWVRFGISPFGIWRPGHPPQVQGFDQYASLYADAKKWLAEGWVDYFTPQLYWRIGPPVQSYPALLHWWHEQNKAERHLWPGNFTSRLLSDSSGWNADELIAQIWVTRAQEGADGNVHFSMKALQRDAAGIAEALADGPYREPAIVPASDWLEVPESEQPGTPEIKLQRNRGQWAISLRSSNGNAPWLWVVRSRYGDDWHIDVVPGQEELHALASPDSESRRPVAPDEVVVSAVDRIGRESEPVSVGGSTR